MHPRGRSAYLDTLFSLVIAAMSFANLIAFGLSTPWAIVVLVLAVLATLWFGARAVQDFIWRDPK